MRAWPAMRCSTFACETVDAGEIPFTSDEAPVACLLEPVETDVAGRTVCTAVVGRAVDILIGACIIEESAIRCSTFSFGNVADDERKHNDDVASVAYLLETVDADVAARTVVV
ncbi:hypothetical protein PMAYCL1PPCAC_09540, partial [Pristionchus mayeri]